jgi:hypothetical protein
MFRLSCLVFLLPCIALPVVADEPPAFPPIGTRYDNIPQAAKTAVTALKKLQTSTEAGIEFADYDRAVSEACSLAKSFSESDDARDMPELRLVLSNACECYHTVRDLWATKTGAGDAGQKHEAAKLFAAARPLLWKAGSENVSAAVALTENPKNELPEIQRLLIDELANLDAEKAMAAARTQKADGPRPPADAAPDLKVLWGLLYDQGDDDGEPEFTASTLSTNFWNIRIQTQGSVILSEAAHRTGFRFENERDAGRAYEALAAQIGQDGKILVGVGESSWANSAPVHEKMDVIFRRGPYVILVRAKVDTLVELSAQAKVVDARIKKYLRVR